MLRNIEKRKIFILPRKIEDKIVCLMFLEHLWLKEKNIWWRKDRKKLC